MDPELASGSPAQLGRLAADRGESRTDNPFDRHEFLTAYQEWDANFVKRRKERTKSSVAELRSKSAQLNWEEM